MNFEDNLKSILHAEGEKTPDSPNDAFGLSAWSATVSLDFSPYLSSPVSKSPLKSMLSSPQKTRRPVRYQRTRLKTTSVPPELVQQPYIQPKPVSNITTFLSTIKLDHPKAYVRPEQPFDSSRLEVVSTRIMTASQPRRMHSMPPPDIRIAGPGLRTSRLHISARVSQCVLRPLVRSYVQHKESQRKTSFSLRENDF
jgi:hypothetical protein